MELPTITPIYVYQTVVENDDKPLEFGIALGDLFWKQKNRSSHWMLQMWWSTSKKFRRISRPWGLKNIGWYHSRTQKLSWKYVEKKLYSLRCCKCKNYYHCLLSPKQNGQPCHSPLNRHKTQKKAHQIQKKKLHKKPSFNKLTSNYHQKLLSQSPRDQVIATPLKSRCTAPPRLRGAWTNWRSRPWPWPRSRSRRGPRRAPRRWPTFARVPCLGELGEGRSEI